MSGSISPHRDLRMVLKIIYLPPLAPSLPSRRAAAARGVPTDRDRGRTLTMRGRSERFMSDNETSIDELPEGDEAASPAPTPPRRGPGHRGQDVRDTMAEMAAKAHEISLEAGSKMAAAMRDVIGAAAGLTAFAIESARDLVQYMVRRGQMTQDEADKLMRDVETAHGNLPKPPTPPPVASPKRPTPPPPSTPAPQMFNTSATSAAQTAEAAKVATDAKAVKKPAAPPPAAPAAPKKATSPTPPPKAAPVAKVAAKPAPAKAASAKAPAKAPPAKGPAAAAKGNAPVKGATKAPAKGAAPAAKKSIKK